MMSLPQRAYAALTAAGQYGLTVAQIIPVIYKGRTPPASATEAARGTIRNAKPYAAADGRRIVCVGNTYFVLEGSAPVPPRVNRHPPEIIDQVVAMSAAGASLAAISRKVGLTAKAAAGILGGRKGHASGASSAPGQDTPLMPVFLGEVLTEISDTARSVGASRSGSCRRPIGHPGVDGFHFCGARSIPSKPYCAACAREMYEPSRPHRVVRPFLRTEARA